jgi:hypothetical protein
LNKAARLWRPIAGLASSWFAKFMLEQSIGCSYRARERHGDHFVAIRCASSGRPLEPLSRMPALNVSGFLFVVRIKRANVGVH